MPMKQSGETSLAVIDRFERGVGWIAYPEERTERASHAIAVPNEEGDDEVWVIDPVDAEGLDELLAEFGTVAGVVVCFNQHKRDAATIATRHRVPVYVPEWMTGVASKIDAPVERFGSRLADTGFEAIRVRNSSIPPWQEVALFDGETLVVSESLGGASYFRGPRERLGVHPLWRLLPPREALADLEPERILVGHGVGVFEDAPGAIDDALADARSNAPRLYFDTAKSFVGW